MKVFMPGWEFPPHFAGGLGTACRGLTRGLAALGVEVTFVLPRVHGDEDGAGARFLGAAEAATGPRTRTVESPLRPYLDAGAYAARRRSLPAEGSSYGRDLLSEVARYGRAVAAAARGEAFDVVHGHDWMTFPGAEAAARERGVPLVLHVHSCERDRSGPRADPRIEAIERAGIVAADAVICVSRVTARRLREAYGADPRKLRVVHNAVDPPARLPRTRAPRRFPGPVVLFLGRVTFQKGPETFLQAAARVARAEPGARFVVAGGGDLLPRMVERAAELGIARRVHFTGFVAGEDLERIFAEADVFAMPSVAEPFGIAALEAMVRGVPAVVSRQSGVAEVLVHALQADFWDAADLADNILAVLRRPDLRERLSRDGRAEARGFRWESRAAEVLDLYRELLR